MMDKHKLVKNPDLDEIVEIDKQVKEETEKTSVFKKSCRQAVLCYTSLMPDVEPATFACLKDMRDFKCDLLLPTTCTHNPKRKSVDRIGET